MGFHSKVPVIAFFGLMHFGISAIAFILGRRWRRNNGGIHYGAFFENPPLHVQQVVDGSKHSFGQIVLFEQSAKFQQSGGVRGVFYIQVNAYKVTN
jgi:hypothetical protein